MCKYCEGDTEVLQDEKLDFCNIEVFLNNDGLLEVNTYNLVEEELGDAPIIGTSVELNFCPMCGRSFINAKSKSLVDSLKGFKYTDRNWKEVYDRFYNNDVKDYIFKALWDSI